MTYPWKNKYPSTTQIISPYIDFSMVPPTVLELATARGSMVHDLCARHAQGEWIIPSLIREDCKGYFDSFLQWFELVAIVHLVESELVDEVYQYCGHPDIIVTMKGQERPRVVDLKTPVSRAKSWRLQLSAYSRLATVGGYDVEKSGTLRLSPKGRPPGYDEYADDPNDFNIFLACLMSWRYFNAKN